MWSLLLLEQQLARVLECAKNSQELKDKKLVFTFDNSSIHTKRVCASVFENRNPS